jgi:alanyl-tRNA synthetase
MITSAEIRQQFLDFFASKEHQIVPSAPIVVKNDPTLLFTNAGMNQFKDYFLGNKKPDFKRIADTQKCLRVSGKHNDLEEVGVDTYHHTMFEMLGNWSFGNYFKAEAIAWSWELLTEVYKLDKDRLYVSVFEGDEKEGIPPSTIAFAEWKKLVAEDHIIYGNKKDNFWEMGETGPCGPCSEIHVDCRSKEERAKIPGRDLVNKDHPQVIEIWNNVFMQYNRMKDGSLVPLPEKHVDTGMGFERLVRVIQGKQSNYDTDVFTGTFAAIEKITGRTYDQSDSKEAIAFRVIADHIRAIGFAISDGQLPSNTGAGYVIRRILRRAVRYYYSHLNYKQPLLFQLMPVLAEQFKNVFPELHQQLDFVVKVVKEEEDAFLRTLDKGLKRIDDIITNNTGKTIEGKAAFELFDTFGFPLDLTKLIASENKFEVDEVGFDAEMLQQKNRSRAATSVDTEDWIDTNHDALQEFVGYDFLEVSTKVVKYRKVKAKGKEQYQLVLAGTPFYAESGGQTGDTGILDFAGEKIEVTDTKKENNLIIHFTDTLPAEIGADVIATVNHTNRTDTTVHHSATHLMHAALRTILGTHVAQKGSMVNADLLRFDFSHFSKLSNEEILQVEALVNEKIRANIPVHIKEMKKEEAIALGAMALFGEKYGDRVRVVIMDPQFSIELCGGTHVGHTGELGYFKIKHESAVAAGVRRIEAVCGKAAAAIIVEQHNEIHQLKEVLKNPKELVKSVEQLLQENNDLRKKIESLEAKQLHIIHQELLNKVQTIEGVSFIGEVVEVSSADALKKLCFEFKKSLTNYLIVLAANVDGKAQTVVMIEDALAASKNLEAPKIIKEHIAPLIKGGGGGQKTLATAGGQDASNLQSVIETVKGLL